MTDTDFSSTDTDFSAALAPTAIIDSDHPTVRAFAERVAGGADSPAEAASRLFYAVRDEVRYDPYVPFYKPEHYRPSQILDLGRGYCVVKAVVLCAVGRAAGIASRLGFCDIRNHGAPPEVIQVLGSDIFTWHGYTEFLLDGRWLKATPAFDRAVCQRHNIDPLTFEGTADAVFPPTDLAGSPYVEYIAHHGSFTDLPLDRLLADWNRIYGKDRVDAWIAAFEQDGATSFKGERGLTV